MRTITAPGVEIKEIDKSQYSPAMVGTACYIMGFSDKGEPYRPMEFTSRASWQSYYGEPDNEAERYFYNAAVEVLNNNGRLYCARLPYDNPAFEKMVGFRYTLSPELSIDSDTPFFEIQKADATIKTVRAIESKGAPYLLDLSAVDELRTDEAKVMNNSFVIVDTTCGTLKPIVEDERKGVAREMIGIMPVVTTAANALFAQKYLEVENQCAIGYETIGCPTTVKTDDQPCNNVLEKDCCRLLNTGSWYSEITTVPYLLSTSLCVDASDIDNDPAVIADIESQISGWIDLSAWNKSYQKTDDDAPSGQMAVGISYLSALTQTEYAAQLDVLSSDPKITSLFGWHGKDYDDNLPETVSQEANTFFPTIGFNSETNTFDREHLKKIGVVVYKMFLDPAEGNKINFEPVEAFVGSLCKDDKDPNTGTTTFIDTIVNTNSKYINVFSNCFNTACDKKMYKETIDMLVMQPGTGRNDDSDKTIATPVLGFYSPMTREDISISKSIYDGMNKAFDKVKDINERDIDIVCDAGIANIASYIKAIFGNVGPYDLQITDDLGNSKLGMWKAQDNNSAVKTWKSVEQKFDQFCKNDRKDCMFIADGLRPMVLAGNKKIVRPSKPSNTIDVDILPYVKWQTGLNTNYGAGYMDWFEVADEFTGDFFWLPPSIKAMGVYINTDTNFNYWDAPAGLNRGVIAATDVAFSPNAKQAGAIYEKNWNYAINYPQDGIVLEGQKTFQVKPSAFDRVNVRRLFLRLERATYRVARYFVYEGNTAYTRQRLVDAIEPYFREAKNKGGIYDYKIICDESINTPEVIDRNELAVKIGIKPVKTAEFILIDFIAVSTGGSFEEAMQ